MRPLKTSKERLRLTDRLSTEDLLSCCPSITQLTLCAHTCHPYWSDAAQLLQTVASPAALQILTFHLETLMFPLLEDLDDPMERHEPTAPFATWHGLDLHVSGLDALESVLESRLPNVPVTFHIRYLYYELSPSMERLREQFEGTLKQKLPQLFMRSHPSVCVDTDPL